MWVSSDNNNTFFLHPILLSTMNCFALCKARNMLRQYVSVTLMGCHGATTRNVA